MAQKKHTPEKIVEREILASLKFLGVRCWVFNSEAVFSPASKVWKKNIYCPEGCPDLLGLNRHGRFVAVELKAPDKKSIRLAQLKFLSDVIEMGGFGAVARSAEELRAIYEKFLVAKDPKQVLYDELSKWRVELPKSSR